RTRRPPLTSSPSMPSGTWPPTSTRGRSRSCPWCRSPAWASSTARSCGSGSRVSRRPEVCCLDLAGDRAEAEPGAVGGGRGGADRHLVAVLEGAAYRPVGQRERLGAAPAQLQQAAALVPVRAADRTRGEQVPGAGGGTVHGHVGQHLRGRPVGGGVR